MIVAPTQLGIYQVLQPFIASALGISANLVLRGLPNRTAMPVAQPGFVVMQLLTRRDLATVVSTWDRPNPDPTTMQRQQSVEVRGQIDCYGSVSGDWAEILSTLLRSDYGCAGLAPTCAPLYCSEARMAPLHDSEDQYEERWHFDLHLQYNPVISTPQEFADTLSAGLINIDERYPPT